MTGQESHHRIQNLPSSLAPLIEKNTASKESLPLFTEESVAVRLSHRTSGVIKIYSPYSTTGAYLSLFISILIVTTCAFGKITQTVSARGVIVSEKDSIKVYAPRQGIIVRCNVIQGQHVNKGENLFSVSDERFGENASAMLSHASDTLRSRLADLDSTEQLAKLKSAEVTRSLEEQIDDLNDQIMLIDKSISPLKDMLAIDQNVLRRTIALRANDIVTITAQESAEKKVFNDQDNLSRLMASRQSLVRDKNLDDSNLKQEPMKLGLIFSDVERQKRDTEIELTKNEIDREITVQSPISGSISAISVYNGQDVTPTSTLMVIDPDDSQLVAQVLVPTNGIGFIKTGAEIAIKYDAFPYQTFGYFNAVISRISDVALKPSEVETLNVSVNPASSVFSAIATLESQYVNTYGHQTKLIAGSTFSASLPGETRYIWQWILNPLLSVQGQALLIGGNNGR